MPNNAFDLEAVKARQAEARAAAAQELDDDDRRHLAAIEVANCRLCDDEGYRGNRVCDHIDRAATAARGIAKCREALQAKQLRLGEDS